MILETAEDYRAMERNYKYPIPKERYGCPPCLMRDLSPVAVKQVAVSLRAALFTNGVRSVRYRKAFH